MANVIDSILQLAEIEEQKWPARLAAIPSWHPRNETGTSEESETETEEDNDNEDDGDDGSSTAEETDWKKMARKHEREAKRQRKRADDADKRVKDREGLDQSEQEKAIQAAREEGEKAARSQSDQERRADRLENATLKLAARGIKLTVTEDDEDKEVMARFADSDDAVTYVERMIRRGDIDEDDLFDDKGRVNQDALSEALHELLEEKPHLRADAGNGNGGKARSKVKGSADGGKGSGGGKSLEDLSVEEHFAAIRKNK